MPIREALQQLHGEWLVVIEPNKGARVRAVDESFVTNMFAIRGAIEALLTGRCAAEASPEDLAALRELAVTCEDCIRRGDMSGTLDSNKRFHRLIFTVSRNPEATALLDCHFSLIEALRHRYGFGPERYARMMEQHRELLDALEQHDVEAAEKLAKAHCESARQDLLARMHNGSAEFAALDVSLNASMNR